MQKDDQLFQSQWWPKFVGGLLCMISNSTRLCHQTLEIYTENFHTFQLQNGIMSDLLTVCQQKQTAVTPSMLPLQHTDLTKYI